MASLTPTSTTDGNAKNLRSTLLYDPALSFLVIHPKTQKYHFQIFAPLFLLNMMEATQYMETHYGINPRKDK